MHHCFTANNMLCADSDVERSLVTDEKCDKIYTNNYLLNEKSSQKPNKYYKSKLQFIVALYVHGLVDQYKFGGVASMTIRRPQQTTSSSSKYNQPQHDIFPFTTQTN